MKTAEKILLTSLEMFNQHGEANVTCVDIAIELDISPGNLYYHFKGKEVIVNELFSMYLQRTGKILVSPESGSLTLIAFIEYLSELFESAHLFRFLYRNPSDLIDKYPVIERRFKRLVKSKEEAFLAILNYFKDTGKLNADNEQTQAFAEFINLLFTQSQSYALLKGQQQKQQSQTEQQGIETANQHTLNTLFRILTPYLSLSEDEKNTLTAKIQSS